jgi:hypothetical protein
LLDFEQSRLSASMPASGNGRAMHAALVGFLSAGTTGGMLSPEPVAADLMALVSALTDAAGRRGNVREGPLVQRIEAAVLGYLSVL